MFDGLPPYGGFIRAYPPAPVPDNPSAYCFVFRKNDVFVPNARTETGAIAPVDKAAALATFPPTAPPLYLGTLFGAACLAWNVETDAPETPTPDGWQAVNLRNVLGDVSEWAAVAGYAHQILRWDRTSGFCPNCGNKTENLPGGWAKICPRCDYSAYPPVSPAVLALVHDGMGRVLLAQKEGWGTRYSILAGFVEPGESLEACVMREVKEEAGVTVKWPMYAGSQPWPFPHQVMVGFVAEWEAGEIVIDTTELSRAAWFRWDELPDLPPPLSLSRRVIDQWVAGEAAK